MIRERDRVREGDDMKSKGNSCVLRESLLGEGAFLNELVKNGGRNTFEVGWLENNKGVWYCIYGS